MVDCFMDADFARQWNSEDPHDPLCIKSCTGYILMVHNCLMQWVSKLQMEIAVSTMEAEYVALSTAMCALIPLCTLVDEVKDLLDPSSKLLPCMTYTTIFENNNGAHILTTSL